MKVIKKVGVTQEMLKFCDCKKILEEKTRNHDKIQSATFPKIIFCCLNVYFLNCKKKKRKNSCIIHFYKKANVNNVRICIYLKCNDRFQWRNNDCIRFHISYHGIHPKEKLQKPSKHTW